MEFYGVIKLVEDLGMFSNKGREGKGGASRRMWRVECPRCSGIRDVQACQVKKSNHSVCQNCMNHYRSSKHNLSGHRLYNLWSQMKARCTNPNTAFYSMYGGSGVDVCEEWQDVEAFYYWSMNNGYDNGLTLDRVDREKGYSPENCRWTTKKVQARNTKRIGSNNKSGYRGVSKSGNGQRWCSFIRVDGKSIYLGTFDKKEEAAKAYDMYVISNKLEHTLNQV